MKRRLSIFLICSIFILNLFSQSEITVKDIYKDYKFSQATVKGFQSMNDGRHYTVLKNNSEIVKYDYQKGLQKEVLFSLESTAIEGETSITKYELSSNEDKILLTTSRESVYRHSYISAHYIYDLTNKQISKVFDKKQQLAKLSPDGTLVAFVVDNNVYVKNIDNISVDQITYDGSKGEVINGMADWVYEEEFALKSAFEWSPDGSKLAFIRFDEAHVKEFQMAIYDQLYPEWNRFKYPKAGEANAYVSVHVYDRATGKIVSMDTGEEKDIYIPRIKWTESSENLSVIRLNRLQNRAEVLLCNSNTGDSKVIHVEANDKFVSEVTDDFINFLNDGKRFVAFSEKSGYKHLYLNDINSGLLNPITSGTWEVDELLAIDQKQNCLYYTSTENSVLERHVYKVDLDGKNKVKISLDKGMNTAVFSKSFDYYLIYNSSSSSPLVVSLCNKNNKVLRVLEDNTDLKEIVKEYAFVKKDFFKFNGPGGEELQGYMFKPADFNENKTYPVLMYVYGGPESQKVLEEWDSRQAWFQMLTQKGYIVSCIDNRGTDGRGEAFRKSTYMQLGKYEVEDQVAGAEYLSALPYIDAKRIGMFGWSYGGYMTLNCLMKANHIFKMGISVAPVTNWRYYDSIYTERFMRKPQDNSDGYDDNSPLSHVEKLKAKLLLVHGSGDDNVHFQNSMMLAEELIQQDKQFDMMFYPNKSHGISGGNTRHHLYTKMTNFILDNL